MAPNDRFGEDATRLARAAEAWLPTDDPTARAMILAFLRQAAAAGSDPIAELRDGMTRWFGSRAAMLPSPRSGPVRVAGGTIVLEPLATLRQPTMWPHRPKRLPNELFSSWLWRSAVAAVAAGAQPRQFAHDALGGLGDDIDQDVAPATLRRLAQVSGQPLEHLAGGTLSVTESPAQDTMEGLAEHILLQDGRFLLGRQARDRLGRHLPVLQYCPRCLQTDLRPHFRRSWRFALAMVCTEHGCRLHDLCWRCGSTVAPLEQRAINVQPHCPACNAPLAEARVIATRLRLRQQALNAMLFYLAAHIPAAERGAHLDTLAFRFGPGASVAERAQKLAGLRATARNSWFATPVRPQHAEPLRMLAEGLAYSGLAKTMQRRPRRPHGHAQLAAVEPLPKHRPLPKHGVGDKLHATRRPTAS